MPRLTMQIKNLILAALALSSATAIVVSSRADAQNSNIRALPPAGFANNSRVARQGTVARYRNGLPPTLTDSFVYEAGAHREHIFGDEGVYDIPPYEEFTKVHRLNIGINGSRNVGLTTNHGSYMPDAWGGDEWVDGPEFSHSGRNSGAPANMQPRYTPRYTSPSGYTISSNRAPDNPQGQDQTSPDPGPQDRNNPNNLPPGYMGVYQHGMFIGSYDPSQESFEDFIGGSNNLNPRGANDILRQIGAL